MGNSPKLCKMFILLGVIRMTKLSDATGKRSQIDSTIANIKEAEVHDFITKVSHLCGSLRLQW